MRDTADAEEEWGGECHEDVAAAAVTAGFVQDVKHTGVAAAYLAEHAVAATENLSVKVMYANGHTATTNLVFKDRHVDEYALEDLPIGHVRHAMHDELIYCCDKFGFWFPSMKWMAK